MTIPRITIVIIPRILSHTNLVNIDAPQIGPWNTILRYVTMNNMGQSAEDYTRRLRNTPKKKLFIFNIFWLGLAWLAM